MVKKSSCEKLNTISFRGERKLWLKFGYISKLKGEKRVWDVLKKFIEEYLGD